MSSIRIKEILSSENYLVSRIIINQNFTALASSINGIIKYLDPSNNGSINSGSILVKKYSNPTNTVLFTNEGSSLIKGNQTIEGNLITNGTYTAIGNQTFGGSLTLNGSSPGTHQFTVGIPIKLQRGTIETQLNNSTTEPYNIIDPNSLPSVPTDASRNIPIVSASDFLKHKYIRLDLSSITGIVTDCTTLILPPVASVTPGQVITFLVDTPAAANVPFNISNTNFSSEYTAPILLNDSLALNTPNVRKIYLTVYADSTGWRVLNAYSSVTY
jgi:hypothetical protein